MTNISRKLWTDLSDAQLLAQCAVDTYRASGPGGQKRNKTSSAVRLRHPPSGLLVIAEESRSQHENKAKAMKRLRHALYLKLREPLSADALGADALAQRPELMLAKNKAGRLDVGRKDIRFWPAAGLVLDVLEAHSGRISDAAQAVGVSTGNLVDFLQTEPKIWEEVQYLRAKRGLKPLRME